MSGWLVDAHVHLHDCFPLSEFLAGAHANVTAGARELGLPADTTGCLLLAEPAGADYFQRLHAGAFAPPADWELRAADEEHSLLLLHRGEPRLVAIAGRQIKAREGLEVLALGWKGVILDGQPIAAVLELVAAAGALVVVPWGFGKWWFGRGARLAALLRRAAPGSWFLGDNGGRPRPSLPPRFFRQAAERGIWTLPGSDPLPFPSQARRAGSYGFFLPAYPDLDRPAAQIKHLLRAAAAQPLTYGQRQHLFHFARAQALLHARRLAARRKAAR